MKNNLSGTGLNNEVIRQIQQALEAFPEIVEVILYGSRAIGNHKNGSDIDITIKLMPSIQPSITLLSNISFAIDELDLVYSFDISLFEQIENKDLIEHINTFGILFYRYSHK
jgi:predicted nucleotidyltransferase